MQRAHSTRFITVFAIVFVLASQISRLTAGSDGMAAQSSESIRKYLVLQRSGFYANIEAKILPKIIYDIGEILKMGWADRVSPIDLMHVHLLISDHYLANPDDQYPQLLTADQISLLYHSHEYDEKCDFPARSILSGLAVEPSVVPGSFQGYRIFNDGSKKPIITAIGSDLESWYVCQINFGLSRKDLVDSVNFTFDPEARLDNPHPFEKEMESGGYFFGLNCLSLE